MSAATQPTPPLRTDIEGLFARAGEHLGYTAWREVTQARVDQFAHVTEDHNFIHVDVERARATPFGGTIAHGFLTLSLLAPLLAELIEVQAGLGINYGLDRVRFPAPAPVGARIRCGAQLASVSAIEGGAQICLDATVEVEGSEKPALFAQCLFRYYA